MNHQYKEWSNQLAPDFRIRNAEVLTELEQVLTETQDETPRALRETQLMKGRYRNDSERIKMAVGAMECARVCREAYPEDYQALCAIQKILLKAKLTLRLDDIYLFLKYLEELPEIDPKVLPVTELIGKIESMLLGQPIPSGWSRLLRNIRQLLDTSNPKKTKPLLSLLDRISKLCSNSITSRLKPDDGWADLMRQDISRLVEPEQTQWEELLNLASLVEPEPPLESWEVDFNKITVEYEEDNKDGYWQAYSNLLFDQAASTQWKNSNNEKIESVGLEVFSKYRLKWLEAIPDSKPGSLLQLSINREMLRGLIWTCENAEEVELTRALRIAASYLFRKNSPLGQTCVRVLASFQTPNCLEELSHLLNQVKADTQVYPVEGARARVAEKMGVSFAELEDLPLPDSGFTELGKRGESLSGFRAEVVVVCSGNVVLNWFKPNGQPQKSVPAKVKREHADQLRNLKATVKEVKSTLSTARERLEAAPLVQLSWNVENWRERYIDHPVVGTLGRRLLWQVDQEGELTTVALEDRGVVNIEGQNVELSPKSKITLWHPLNSNPEEVLNWREWMLKREKRQPFKQAHREVYLLTDAERETEVYSNRFAGHILKQSQFRTLARTRGWKSDYLGFWDGCEDCKATKHLLEWGLRAEYWLGGVNDERADAGGVYYISTDQVRFYHRDEREPLKLEDVPLIPFSEIMRDVDLFIGVCSLGNDPNWHDGQFSNYWENYSFGELSETARTRRNVLERLLPRLKIADRCSFDDRFLIVRGDLRTYRIHLRSSNILMEPNNEYLCIVPDRSVEESLYLPFEGDNRLSVILSKAFLLADDSSITDPTITSQIQRGA